MIAIARKNLPCLCLSPNSFLCNSCLNFIPSIRFFSTLRIKRLIPSPEICDVLVNKHIFSPELALLAASRLPEPRSPKRADSILSYLKENSFTTAQLQKIVRYDPRILGFTIEALEFKSKVFQDLGLSPEDIAKIISINPVILHSSTENKIIPRISVLKALLGSNHGVARLLRKSAWFVVVDLEKTLLPNVEILKSCGLPTERVLHYLYIFPRCFLHKSDIMRKSVDRAMDIGVPLNSVVFMQALSIFSYMSEGMWEVKLQTFHDLGFSDSDILKIFRRCPSVFSSSIETVEKKIKLLLATGKYNISDIVTTPTTLMRSIEKKLEPRLQIFEVLESKNLIKKWPSLGAIVPLTDDVFFKRFVSPYAEKVGEAFDGMSYLKGKINQT